MAESGAIIGLPPWWQTPLGRYLLAWEQRELDEVVADLFGFHALQVGLPELAALDANRMPHRWLASASVAATSEAGSASATAASLLCDFDALPFDSSSLDLVVLPHALELARDPHLALGEVARVLRPEGRIVIVGFNPASLWGLNLRMQAMAARLRRGSRTESAAAVDLIGFRRVRDWLRLLSFEVEASRFGCYRPPLTSPSWLARTEWMERVGDRWWPVLGAVYLLVAVKRVRGMRLVGLLREQRLSVVNGPAIVAQRDWHPSEPVEFEQDR